MGGGGGGWGVLSKEEEEEGGDRSCCFPGGQRFIVYVCFASLGRVNRGERQGRRRRGGCSMG